MGEQWERLYQYLIDHEFDPETVTKRLNLSIKKENNHAKEHR